MRTIRWSTSSLELAQTNSMRGLSCSQWHPPRCAKQRRRALLAALPWRSLALLPLLTSAVVRAAAPIEPMGTTPLAVRADGEVLVSGSGVVRSNTTTITMTGGFANGFIYYTVDGTAPSFLSTQYKHSFELTKTTTLRAVSYSIDYLGTLESGPFEIRIVSAYQVVSSTRGQGSVSLSPSLPLYEQGSKVTAAASPASGWEFLRWEWDLAGSSPNATLTVEKDQRVRAVFREQPWPELPVATTHYSLTTTTAGGGTITGNETRHYAEGTIVNLTAVPSAGWQFMHWTGDTTGADSQISVIMDEQKQVEAVFGTTVATTAAGPGTVRLVPAAPLYAFGSKVLAQAEPTAGNCLWLWSNAGSGSANPLIYEVNTANPTISALFTAVPVGEFHLEVQIEGVGVVSLDPPRNLFAPGEHVTLTAASGIDAFSHWTGAASGTETTLTVQMTSNKSVTAWFRKAYRIRTSVEGRGTVFVEPAQSLYLPGSAVRLTAIPDTRWAFTRWRGTQTAESSRLQLVIANDTEIKAYFEPLPGALLWSWENPSVVPSPTVAPDGTVYMVGVSNFTSLNLDPPPFRHWTTPYVVSYKLDGNTGRLRGEKVLRGGFGPDPDQPNYFTAYPHVLTKSGPTCVVAHRYKIWGAMCDGNDLSVLNGPGLVSNCSTLPTAGPLALASDGNVFVGVSSIEYWQGGFGKFTSSFFGPSSRYDLGDCSDGHWGAVAIGPHGIILCAGPTPGVPDPLFRPHCSDRGLLAFRPPVAAPQWFLQGVVPVNIAVAGDGTAFFAGDRVYAVESESGSVKWTSTAAAHGVIVLGDGDAVFVGALTGLTHLRPENGAVVWKSAAVSGVVWAAALMDGTILVVDASGVACVDATSGALLWRGGSFGAPSPPTSVI